MSKKSRGRGISTTKSTANRRLPREVTTPNLAAPVRKARRAIATGHFVTLNATLREAQDRRNWHPAAPLHRPLKTVSGTPSYRLVVAKPKRKSGRSLALSRAADTRRAAADSLPHRIAFDAPKEVLLCVRRQRRKEVIFATRKAGAGKAKQRRPRRNQYSEVSC